MTKECLMFVRPQAGKAPRVLGRGVRPRAPEDDQAGHPYQPRLCRERLAVSGWRLGTQRDNYVVTRSRRYLYQVAAVGG
jgi:hypothetical protein